MGGSKGSVKRAFKRIQDLRDALSHSNDYAGTPEAAKALSETIRTVVRITKELEATVPQAS